MAGGGSPGGLGPFPRWAVGGGRDHRAGHGSTGGDLGEPHLGLSHRGRMAVPGLGGGAADRLASRREGSAGVARGAGKGTGGMAPPAARSERGEGTGRSGSLAHRMVGGIAHRGCARPTGPGGRDGPRGPNDPDPGSLALFNPERPLLPPAWPARFPPSILSPTRGVTRDQSAGDPG